MSSEQAEAKIKFRLKVLYLVFVLAGIPSLTGLLLSWLHENTLSISSLMITACAMGGQFACMYYFRRRVREVRGHSRRATASQQQKHYDVLIASKLILCLFISPDKQEDRLADLEEKLNKLWIPNFGRCIGQLVCLCHAIRSAGSIVRIGLVAAIADRIARALGW